jgi:lipopolysaccharide/colanic/teichoic acid biosynthesis glycosyltransferase
VFEKNGTANGDKITDDFRVTNWGKIFRKFWIDELPMLFNWAKRDLKLVGVRPLSEHKFYTYPKHLQKKRTMVKPGLVPPFYADLPNTPEEFFATEERYLDAYMKKPIRTDIRYFFKAMYNIFVKKARSG